MNQPTTYIDNMEEIMDKIYNPDISDEMRSQLRQESRVRNKLLSEAFP